MMLFNSVRLFFFQQITAIPKSLVNYTFCPVKFYVYQKKTRYF